MGIPENWQKLVPPIATLCVDYSTGGLQRDPIQRCQGYAQCKSVYFSSVSLLCVLIIRCTVNARVEPSTSWRVLGTTNVYICSVHGVTSTQAGWRAKNNKCTLWGYLQLPVLLCIKVTAHLPLATCSIHKSDFVTWGLVIIDLVK